MKKLLYLIPLFITLNGHTQDNCNIYLINAKMNMENHEHTILVNGAEKFDGRAIKDILSYLECKK